MTTSGPQDPFDEFWALFAGELEDYLTTIETILAATPVDLTRVDELFRAFHSVKGGAAALALHCIERVAHAAEDVLHLVRNGRKALTTEVVTALLAAVDEMRRLQDTAMATRRDQPVNDEIVALLRRHKVEDAALPLPPPATEAEELPPPEPAIVIADDTLTLLQDKVLVLIGAVGSDPAGLAVELAEIAEGAGLGGIAGAARRLADKDGDRRWAWLDLASRLRSCETASGQSLGAGGLAAALEPALAERLLELVADLKTNPEDLTGWLKAVRLLSVLEIPASLDLAELVANGGLTGMGYGETGPVADLFASIGIALTSGMPLPLDEIAALRDERLLADGATDDVGDSIIAPEIGGAHAWPLDILLQLIAAVSDRRKAVLVLLDMEKAPEIVENIGAILYSENCLYNRSRLDLGGGLFEYLVAVTDVNAFAARLSDADPQRLSLRSVRVADANAEPGVEVLPAAAPPRLTPLPVPRAPAPQPAPVAPSQPVPVAVSAATPPAETPAEPPPAVHAPAPPPAHVHAAEAMVRVPSMAIDGFMDQIGELRLGLTSLGLILDGSAAQSGSRATTDIMRRLDRAVRALYDGALSLRVVPIGTLFSRLMRPIRDTAVLVGKQVTLTTAGDDVQVDKAMIEMLVDPLTHIVRNSVDHGIETPDQRVTLGKPREGAIRIRARQAASLAIIEVEDDGGGIDVSRVRAKAVAKGLIGLEEAQALSDEEATQLILLPGFSTRDEVTAISGRGVGMDIVVTAIKKLGGRLTIDSRLGLGTRMTIEFPVSAAMQRVVSTELCGQTIALHERSVQEVLVVPVSDIQRLGPRLTLSLRGIFLPVVDLAALLGLREPVPPPVSGSAVVVVVDNGVTTLGLLVEKLAVRREVFFKRMHPLLERNPLIAGTAVIGAGTIMFALDTQALFAAATKREDTACLIE